MNKTTNNSGVYVIENLINGKVYVGSSVNIARRFYQHRSGLERNKHGNAYLQNAWGNGKRKHTVYLVTTPDNETITVTHFERFCAERQLQAPNLRKVAQGTRTQHKGYKCSYAPMEVM